jgi:hypothetical protein
MAYNKINYYKRVIRVQDKVLELQRQNEDLTLKEIYWQHIYEKVETICYRTYNTYLGVPAKRELKKLLEAQNLNEEDLNQLTLF